MPACIHGKLSRPKNTTRFSDPAKVCFGGRLFRCGQVARCTRTQCPQEPRPAPIRLQLRRHVQVEESSPQLREHRYRPHLSFLFPQCDIDDPTTSNDLRTAENLLTNLKVAPRSDPELTFQIDMLEIDYLHRTLNYPEALTKIEDLASQSEKDDSDVSHRVRLLTAKALHFHKCGRPQKGLSLALRATTAAYRARIMPALWEATGALALAMVGIEQFDFAGELLDAVIYQVSKILVDF